MASAVAERVFPGAVLRASVRGRLVYEKAFGVLDYEKGQPVVSATVFDLASLTKPLATVPAILRLMQAGRLNLESTLGHLMTGYSWGEKSEVTVGQLLSHTSGLPDHRPYFQTLRDLPLDQRPRVLRRLLAEEPLVAPPGDRVCYSDLGFMILAWVVEAVSGQPLSVFVQKEVYEPLNIDDLFYIKHNEGKVPAGLCAPTEQCPWRKKMLCGEVHDDNAWVMGGEGGHAGLFGTAAGIDRLLEEFWINDESPRPSPHFDPDLVRLFLTEWGHTRRTPGFDMPALNGSSSGRSFPKTSVGHLGFTGTSFWMDPHRALTVILLTNRVHPSRDNLGIRQFRPRIHDALMEALACHGPSASDNR